jgi:hypothetical protein
MGYTWNGVPGTRVNDVPIHHNGGPKGIRTPDLLAASQPGLTGVLTCENAGRE